jgi:hypothetical protein
MAALTGDIHYERFGTGDVQCNINMPLGASITVYRGSIALTDTSGNVKNSSAVLSTDTCWGIIQDAGPGTLDSGPGINNPSTVAGFVTVDIAQGAFLLASGAGSDQLSQSAVGKSVYVMSEYTVGLTSGGGNRPVAGVLMAVLGEVPFQAPGAYAVRLGNTQQGGF